MQNLFSGLNGNQHASSIKRRQHIPVEDGAILGEPVTVNSGDALHVLLGGHDQLVVDDVVRGVGHAVEGTCGMQATGHSGAQVHVLCQALD